MTLIFFTQLVVWEEKGRRGGLGLEESSSLGLLPVTHAQEVIEQRSYKKTYFARKQYNLSVFRTLLQQYCSEQQHAGTPFSCSCKIH